MTFLFSYDLKPALISTLIIVGVLSVLFIGLSFLIKKIDPMQKTPMWLVPFMWLVDIMNNFIKINIGKRWRTYSPWFLTLVIFIFFANSIGIFALENPTGYIIVTACLAFCSFLIIQITGIVSLGLGGYLKGFLDPTPVMLPMNILSEFTFPLSLCLRLFGNVISGSAIGILIKNVLDGWLGLLVVPVVPFINLIFDIAFTMVQVVVFVILSIVFTSAKIKDEEKIYSK